LSAPFNVFNFLFILFYFFFFVTVGSNRWVFSLMFVWFALFINFMLLCLVINAENAAHRSEKFATMATRTRQEYLKDLANNYTTTTVVDPGQKFCKASYVSRLFISYFV